MRRLTAMLAALILVVAACGDDDDATAAPDGGDDTVETPPMGPAELSAEDQTSDGGEVTALQDDVRQRRVERVRPLQCGDRLGVAYQVLAHFRPLLVRNSHSRVCHGPLASVR